MDMGALVVLTFIRLTGPGGQEIEVNTAQIVTLRERRDDEKHMHEDVHCILHMADGKFVAVVERCEVVQQLINAEPD